MTRTSPYIVMVLGGYGFFGRRLVQRLALQHGLLVLVAGRSASKLIDVIDALRPVANAQLEGVQLDVQAPGLAEELKRLQVNAVVHTCGPFQGQDYAVARACIEAGAHYIDLADGREFVCGIAELHSQAKAAGVAVISGASSVPALSSAVVDLLAVRMRTVARIDIGISPGNQTDRGLATVRAILGYCGKRLPAATPRATYGWLSSWSHLYPAPVGRRLLSPCDVPDLSLLTGRYAGQPQVRFGAGLELPLLHRGMNVMSGLARLGLVRDWSRYAAPLKRMSDWFRRYGTDTGAMHVQVVGTNGLGGYVKKTWTLIAEEGDGPYVPTLAAAALVRRLAAGVPLPAGAQPCLGLVSVADFAKEMHGLQIKTELAE